MSDLSDVCCTVCKADMATQFGGMTPTRAQVVISGNQFVPGPCYVADEITFVSPSALIFAPNADQGESQSEYAVICRKLIVKGGKPPVDTTPCNPGDPGTRYGNTNVITWKGRLTSAAAGAAMGPPAPQAPTSGLDGTNGQTGNPGSNGAAPAGGVRAAKLVLVALEVEILSAGNLVIDWAGQNGGDGGAGQLGGNAGSGTTGNNGSDESWPSSGCSTPTGSGGNGGNGGSGGAGGNGGNGGPAGQIVVISTAENIAATGPFNDPSQFTYVTKSVGGKGGAGGHGGLGGDGGSPGVRSSQCAPGTKGTTGASSVAVIAPGGAPGNPGASPSPNPELETLSAGACAEPIASPLIFGANTLPQSFRRCSSGSGIGSLSLVGQYLDQVTGVSTSLAGVTVTIDGTSTDTQLDLSFLIAANSATGLGDLIFAYAFPSTLTQTLPGAINVTVCAATGIAPATGAQATTVGVTITGQAFDLVAAVHQVSVSGLGIVVQAGSVAVVDDNTMTCNLVIDATAPRTTRNVIVTAGTIANPCQSTLVQAFTVT